MGHYASEMGDDRPRWAEGRVSGYDHREKIEAFTDGNAGSSCPVCGASLDWNWAEARNLIRHIDWHAQNRLDRSLRD